MKNNIDLKLIVHDDSSKEQFSKEYVNITYAIIVIFMAVLINVGFIGAIKSAFDLTMSIGMQICAIFCYGIIVAIIEVFTTKRWLKRTIKIASVALLLLLAYKTIISGCIDMINEVLYAIGYEYVIDTELIEEYLHMDWVSDAQNFFWLYIMLVIMMIMVSKMLASKQPLILMHLQFVIIVLALVFGNEISFINVMFYVSFTIAFLTMRSKKIMKETSGYFIVAFVAVIIMAATLFARLIVGNSHQKPNFIYAIQDKISSLELPAIFDFAEYEKRGELDPYGPKQTGEVLFKLQVERFTEPLYLKSYTANRYANAYWNDREYLFKDSKYKSLREELTSSDFKTQAMQSEMLTQIRRKESYINAAGFSTIKTFANRYYETKMYVTKVCDDIDYIIYPYDAYLDNFYFSTDMQPYAPGINTYSIKRVNLDTNLLSSTKDYLTMYERLRNLDDASLNTNYFSVENIYREFVYDEYTHIPKGVLDKVKKELKNYNFESYDDVERFTKSLQAYFTENFTYSLTPGKAPSGKSEIEYFLYENKSGYCVYFATAATLIYRAAGIPARYAEGYLVLPEDISKNGAVYDAEVDVAGTKSSYTYKLYDVEVTDKMSHAWVEIYVDGYGWMPVEVTPSALERPNVNPQQPTTQAPTEPVTQQPTTEEPTTQRPTEEPTTQAPSEEPTSEGVSEETTSEEATTEEASSEAMSEESSSEGPGKDASNGGKSVKRSRTQIYMLILLLLVLSAIVAILVRHRYYFGKRYGMIKKGINNNDPQNIVDLYDYMHLLLSYIGYAKAKDMTYTVYLKKLNSECKYANVTDFNQMINVATYTAFSDKPALSVDTIKEYGQNVANLRNAIYNDLKWYRKISFTYFDNL